MIYIEVYTTGQHSSSSDRPCSKASLTFKLRFEL